MATTETLYMHVVLNEHQEPLIAPTTMRVIQLVMAQRANGWSPDELAFQYPFLSLGQIHSALAYYWDHRQELEEEIERDLQIVEELQKRTLVTPIVGRLRDARALAESIRKVC